MDAYEGQSAGRSADVIWPTATVASVQFPTRIAAVRPKSCVQRWRVRNIYGKYMPNGSDGRADTCVAKVIVGEKRGDSVGFMATHALTMLRSHCRQSWSFVRQFSVSASPPARAHHAREDIFPAPDISRRPLRTWHTPRCDRRRVRREWCATPKCTQPRRSPS